MPPVSDQSTTQQLGTTAIASYAAGAYAGDALAERQWQTWRLLDYIEGRAG